MNFVKKVTLENGVGPTKGNLPGKNLFCTEENKIASKEERSCSKKKDKKKSIWPVETVVGTHTDSLPE